MLRHFTRFAVIMSTFNLKFPHTKITFLFPSLLAFKTGNKKRQKKRNDLTLKRYFLSS